MAFFHLDFNHTNDGDGDGWGDGVGAGDAFNSIPNAIAGGAVAGDIIFGRNFKSDLGANQSWVGPTAVAGLPLALLGVKAATTNTGGSVVTSDLIVGRWTGDADEAWDTPAEALPGLGSTAQVEITISGHWFMYAIDMDPVGRLNIGTSAADSRQTYVECKHSSGSSANTQTIRIGYTAGPSAQRFTFVNPEFVATRSAWNIQPSRSGLVEIIGGRVRLGEGTAPTTLFAPLNANGVLYCLGFDMSAIAAGDVVTINANFKSLYAKFINCAKGSGALVTGSRDLAPWRVESYLTDADPGTTLTSTGSILDLDIQGQDGEIVQDTTTFLDATPGDGAAGKYSLAITATVGDFFQPYCGLATDWQMLRVGSGLETTMTVHIANDSAGDLNDDDFRIEVMQPNSSGDEAMNEYQFTGMDLLGTPTAMTNGTDGDWTFAGAFGNAQEIAVAIDPAYQGTIYWRGVSYTTDTIALDPAPVLS